MIRAPAGLGKTTLVLDAIAQLAGDSCEVYVPTHALAQEVEQILLAKNPELTVNVIAGRSHIGDNGKPLCKKHELAEQIARAGGEVFASLCKRKKGKADELCPHYASCPYIAQFTPAEVTIFTHAYIPPQRTGLEPGVPKLAIIDESFFTSCFDIIEVPLSLLRAPFLGPAAAPVCAEIERAFVEGRPLVAQLFSIGNPFEQCPAAAKELKRGAPRMSPAMNDKDRRLALQQLEQRNQLCRLLGAICHELGLGRPGFHGLKYCPETQTIAVHGKKSISRFHDQQGNEAEVLILDANANKQLINQFFEVGPFHAIQATRQVEVIQCRSTRCSTTSLVPKRNSDRKSKREAMKRLGELEAMIARLAVQHRRLLVVGPQVITGNPKAKVKPLIKVPVNVDLAHFNAIRGIDQWKDHDAIVVIGRNEPPIEAVEAIARCIFLTDREPLQFATEWMVQERGYRLTHGQFGVDVICHPDPRVQIILEQLREGESQQAIDRLRLVHASTRKRVYLLSNVVLDVDVDHLVTWEELMNGGGRLEQAWNTLAGVMPLAAAWLASQFPRLWQTAEAAKPDVAEAVKEGRFTNIFNISNPTLFRHRYRPAPAPGSGRRQRAWSVCLSVHADVAVTRAALEELLGCAVEMQPPKTPVVVSAPPSMPAQEALVPSI